MPYFQWLDAFSVNVEEIDDQHKTLVDMINKLHEALTLRRGREVHCEIINGMVDYATNHFATEERYMQQFSFPGYEAHKKEHDQFTVKAQELQERMEGVDFILTLEILNFLRGWLKNHIMGTDKKYSGFFNENGLL